MNRIWIAAIGAACALAVHGLATAQIVKVTASGVVANGFDQTGVFDLAGQALDGQAFSYFATYNIAKAGYDNDGSRSDIYGGTAYSYLAYDPPGIGSGAITINGVTQTIAGDYNSWLFANVNNPYAEDFQLVADRINNGSLYESNAVTIVESPGFGLLSYPDISYPSGNLCQIDSCTYIEGNFGFYETLDGAPLSQAYGNLAPDIVTITVSPVPEPSTWAMLLLSVSCVGAVLRSKRRLTVA